MANRAALALRTVYEKVASLTTRVSSLESAAKNPIGNAVTQFTPVLTTVRQNGTGTMIWISVLGGVISGPQQNGHIYLEISADGATNWVPIDYIACRNNQTSGTGAGTVQAGGPNIANGQGLQGFVPKDWYYRLRGYTAAGYSAPSWVFDAGASGVFVQIAN